jgi:signal transduction histidine kinase/CheY-like chemotaxis protein
VPFLDASGDGRSRFRARVMYARVLRLLGDNMLAGLTDWLFDDSALTAHGFCLLWEPGLIWTYTLSDAAIALAYFSIPAALLYVARKRSELMIRPLLWLFAAFILLCGTTHWLDVVTLWWPWYGIQATVKAATAIVSVMVAVSLWWYMPRFLAAPSQAQLQAANEALLASREQLAQSQKMEAVGQLTGGIAHDFNNMLQVIMGSLELVEKRLDRGRYEDIPRYVGAIRQASERAARLTNRLLAFARRQALRPRRLDSARLIEGMRELIERTVGPGIPVHVEVSTEDASILCDPGQLESAIVNLVLNARDAMPDGGQLTIAIREVDLSAKDLAERDISAGTFIEIAVIDTGDGMVPDVLKRAFEPFFTTRTANRATGLGLSQVYGFMRQSGGFVDIRSRPGDGTVVRLLFPQADITQMPDFSEVPAATTNLQASGGHRILVVDDEREVRAQIVLALRELGCLVEEAADGAAGLQLFEADRRFDLIVTDVGMPGLNGRQFADAARQIEPKMPILLITGYAGREADQLQHIRNVEILHKPFALKQLIDRINLMLAS